MINLKFKAINTILKKTTKILILLLILNVNGAFNQDPKNYKSYAQEYSSDIVVYGATASGVIAAIAAAKDGNDVLLFEPGQYVGGMVTGGLSHTDYGDRSVIGGLALEFYRRVGTYYDTHAFHWRGPEPHVAEKILKEWLKEANVKVIFNKRIDKVVKNNQTIQKITFLDGSEAKAKVFIDAGYEGDLMAKAGISYTVGRESKSEYNESWAGRQPITFTSHQVDARINPFFKNEEKNLLPLINPRPMVEIGEGDKGVQSYCFRLIVTNRPDNMVPWTKPENYDPAVFELVRRYYEAKPNAPSMISFRSSPTLPNGKADINSSTGISTNLLDGSNWEYPNADYNKRDSIWQWHKDYTLGLAYFLANDPSVPAKVREHMTTFGLCKDEYVDNDHFPHQLYIRVGRRMKGEYFMTQHDLMDDTVKYDAIGMGAYNIDVREVQKSYIAISRFPNMKYETYNEGYLSIPVAPYEIPYRSLLPKFEECQNLLVPVCLSGSNLAIASIRMEPQYMVLGHASGIAASMAVEFNRPVQKIDIYQLQEKLKKQEQILSLQENPYGVLSNQNEIIIDNGMSNYVKTTGNWNSTEIIHPEKYELNFSYSTGEISGEFQFIPYFFRSGNYDVYIRFPTSKKNESEVPVKIYNSHGEKEITIDQQKGGGEWTILGKYSFKKGQRTAVGVISEQNKYTIADAVKFVLVK
jgi:hypothetical protein